MKFVKT